MAFEYLSNVPLEQAKREYLDILIQNGMASKTEEIPVAEAAGRITGRPGYARINAPHYNASALDGIAVDAKLTSGAGKTAPVSLSAGQFHRINSGDPLPDGCDAVIMDESIITAGESVTFFEKAVPWQNIKQIGEDVCAGEMILPSYSKVTPSALGAMLTGGVKRLTVVKRPIVGIVPAGCGHVPPVSDTEEGDVPESNSAIFAAMLHGWGAETLIYPAVRGDLLKTGEALIAAISECDVVILIADSSAENEHFAADAIAGTGKILHHGLAIKPGKPAILGYSGAKPVLGVPGYPVSGIIVIEELLRPIVEFLCRKASAPHSEMKAVLSRSVVSSLEYQEFVRVRMGFVGERLIASPLNIGAGIVTSFMKADGIIEVPQGVEGFRSGEKVSVRLLRPERDFRSSLVVAGSHDPLLDELAELLRVECGDVSMGSAHVGSMGGLLAVRRREAHMAGIHLLDEETGEYNAAFVKKILPKGGVRLVECVKRTQGLILQLGNPMKITGIADLSRDGLRYVNRQKGSGTRILTDYLCRRAGVDTAAINGYGREEYTHTSVASMVASGSADAGLGIFSAARLYGLEFIPVCQEQYDLLIPDYAWDLPVVRKLIEILGSDAFRQRLDALGGYVTENPGKVRKAY